MGDYIIMTAGKKKKYIFLSIVCQCLVLLAGRAAAADISTHSFAGCNFPDTGQTQCYDTGSPPVPGACPRGNLGQDGDYPSGAQPRYTIYNLVGISSVTVDNRTGLMWITNPLTDAGFNKAGPSIWAVAISSCENLTYAGFTDWRLPNVKELMSIVDYGAASAPRINTAAFPGTVPGSYQTSTTNVINGSGANYSMWSVDFNTGQVNYGAFGAKANAAYNVRCVRGGP